MSDVQLDQVRSKAIPINGQAKGAGRSPIWRVTPECDVYESDGEYLVVIDMPGASADSLNVQVAGAELQIRAERVASLGEANAGAALGVFERRIELPAEVDAASASAKLQNGVLEIRISKSAWARRMRIPINTN